MFLVLVKSSDRVTFIMIFARNYDGKPSLKQSAGSAACSRGSAHPALYVYVQLSDFDWADVRGCT